jgi:hypothetical protein
MKKISISTMDLARFRRIGFLSIRTTTNPQLTSREAVVLDAPNDKSPALVSMCVYHNTNPTGWEITFVSEKP